MFQNLLKRFIKSSEDKQMATKKCAIMTQYYGKNYGSVLTAFALQKLLDKLGYYSELIKVHKPFGFSKDFSKKYLRETFQCLNNDDFQKLNKDFDTFILGSDNQLDFMVQKQLIYRYLFNYAEKDKKKIIISGSCGNPELDKTKFDFDRIKTLLETMDYVSFREYAGQQMCNKFFNLSADWILDPVFLLDKSEYFKLAQNSKHKISNEKQLMTYILYENDDKTNIVNEISQKYGYKINRFEGNENASHYANKVKTSVENWINSILNSELIVTDSFHCVCFSLIFNKPFICLKNPKGYSRFESLFKMFEMNYPMINSYDDYAKNIDIAVFKDFLTFNNVLQNKKEKDIETLTNVLNAEKTVSKSQETAYEKLQEYNKTDLTINDKSYKNNRFLYLNIVEPFIEPIVRTYRMKKEAKSD